MERKFVGYVAQFIILMHMSIVKYKKTQIQQNFAAVSFLCMH